MNHIPVFKPLIKGEEIDAARKSLEIGWLGMGSDVGKFEDAIKEYIGASDRHVVAVSTGHAALHLALLLMGVGPGDEVITPSFNNAADFQAILATGAEPVFCDIDEDSLCIDLNKAEEMVTDKTKAMIVMDYDCVLCDHDGVADFAKSHGIRILHDAAHSFGSKYRGRAVGSFSDICMFSFDPVKTITSIDGGMLVVQSEEEMQALQEMRLIGMTQPTEVMYSNARAWTYDLNRIGFRYHMSNLHAAIGLAQLEKIKEIGETRREAARIYNEKLSSIPEIRCPMTDFNDIIPFLYYVRVPKEKRDKLREYLANRGIDTGIHWQPGHWFTLLQNYRCGDMSVTNRVGHEIISLPLHSMMISRDIERVVDAIYSFFRSNS